MSIWDTDDLKINDAYVKFDKPGDTVTGTVVNIRVHRWDDGSTCPQILLDCDGEERTLTAGAVRLKAALAELRPEKGDLLTVTLANEERRQGGKTLRHWDVSIADKTPTSNTDEAVTLEQSTLTAEQKAALKAIGL